MSESITAQLRAFVRDNFFVPADQALADDDSLLERRILDSTGFLELVTFLESTYGFRVEDSEMIPENLETLVNISGFVQRKTARS